MSLEAITWAFRQDVPGTAKLVLLALANRADDETGECWPGMARIAKDATCSVRSAQMHIAALIRNGYLGVRRMYSSGDGRQRSNHYWILFDRPDAPWQTTARHPDDDQDIAGEGADIAPHTITADEENAAVEAKPAAPPPVQPAAPPCIEPSGIESKDSESMEGQRAQAQLPASARPPALAPDQAPRAAIDRSKPKNFDPSARQRAVEAQQAAERARKPQRHPVIEGSDPWKYHVKAGHPPTLTTFVEHNGKRYRGWYFPDLYPPKTPPPALSPDDRTAPVLSPENETDLNSLADELEGRK